MPEAVDSCRLPSLLIGPYCFVQIEEHALLMGDAVDSVDLRLWPAPTDWSTPRLVPHSK